jgi:hypothetical protein
VRPDCRPSACTGTTSAPCSAIWPCAGERRTRLDRVEEQRLGLAVDRALEPRDRRRVGADGGELLEQHRRGVALRVEADADRHELDLNGLVGGLRRDLGQVQREPARRRIGGRGGVGGGEALRLEAVGQHGAERLAELLQRLRRQLFDEQFDQQALRAHARGGSYGARRTRPARGRDGGHESASRNARRRARRRVSSGVDCREADCQPVAMARRTAGRTEAGAREGALEWLRALGHVAGTAVGMLACVCALYLVEVGPAPLAFPLLHVRWQRPPESAGLRAVASGLLSWLLGCWLCLTVGARVYVWVGAASWS